MDIHVHTRIIDMHVTCTVMEKVVPVQQTS